MQEHRSQLWGIAVGLCFATAVGFACPVLANGDRNCGLESAATSEDAASAAQFKWPTYRLTDIGILLRSPYSYATAINNRGEVVGNLGDTINASGKAFFYRGGRVNNFPPLPGEDKVIIYSINDSGTAFGLSLTQFDYDYRGYGTPVIHINGRTIAVVGLSYGSYPYAINNSGHIVGAWGIAPGGFDGYPFLYREGVMTSLPGSPFGAGYAINNRDVVVGERHDWHASDQAFMYKDGRITGLSPTRSDAYAINDRGQIVGVSASATGGARAFLYNQGKGMVNLGTLRSTDAYSRALAINNCGHVVGFSGSADDINSVAGLSAFLYAKGRMVDLNSLVFNRSAFRLTAASGINDHGQIVGRGSINGQLHAFLLTPRHRGADCSKDGQH